MFLLASRFYLSNLKDGQKDKDKIKSCKQLNKKASLLLQLRLRLCKRKKGCKYCYYYYLYDYYCQYKCSTAVSISKVKTIYYLTSSMVVEVIRTNFRLFKIFLRENFTSIKSIKSKKNIKNTYKRISNFLKHKTLNKQLSLRCFL